MTTGRKTLIGIASAALAFAALSGPAAAEYPERSITFVVPYGTGGNGDIVSRILADGLQEVIGQPVVVVNRPGAGGNIGAAEAADAAPDGYTFVLGTNTHTVNMTLYPDPGYDLRSDFEAVSRITTAPMVLIVNPSVEATNVDEFVALAKSKPGELNYSSGGNGSSPHIFMELFKQRTGIDVLHVPYKGVAAGLTDLIAGRVQSTFTTQTSALAMIQADQLRPLAIASEERSDILPDVPTLTEAGVEGMESGIWQGVLVPAGTPREIVDKLNAAIAEALKNPEVRAKFEAQGVTPGASTPEAFEQLIEKEVQRWADVISQAEVTLQ